MAEFLLLLAGFVLLVKGADLFVAGASSIARHFHIPPILIGLTIVAFGTSAPESAVSITAALSGSNGIAVGNVLGSNIFNLSITLGVAAFLYPLKVSISTIKKEIPMTLISALLMVAFILDPLFGDAAHFHISRSESFVFLVFFAIFIFYILESIELHHESMEEDITLKKEPKTLRFGILKTLIGLAGVIAGGHFVVTSSTSIALRFGLSDTLIGLTIVAIGTSLPELVTSGIAAYRKETDLAVGNIIGSNLFNVFFVLGISSMLHPITLSKSLVVDLIFNVALTIMVYFFSRSEHKIDKKEGVVLFTTYLAYMVYLIAGI